MDILPIDAPKATWPSSQPMLEDEDRHNRNSNRIIMIKKIKQTTKKMNFYIYTDVFDSKVFFINTNVSQIIGIRIDRHNISSIAQFFQTLLQEFGILGRRGLFSLLKCLWWLLCYWDFFLNSCFKTQLPPVWSLLHSLCQYISRAHRFFQLRFAIDAKYRPRILKHIIRHRVQIVHSVLVQNVLWNSL